MSRESRKRRLQLKPHLDKLEMRRLMSVGDAKSHFAHVISIREAVLESQLAAWRPEFVRVDFGPETSARGGPRTRCTVPGAPEP